MNVPLIESATFNGKKLLTIQGQAFGTSPTVLINGGDRSSRVRTSIDATIKMKGKAAKLGLVTGANTIQVRTAGGTQTNVFTLTR